MAVEKLFITLKLGGNLLNEGLQRFTKSIDEWSNQDLTLTSNQSGVSVAFGGVATCLSWFLYSDQGINVSHDSQVLVINTQGCVLVHNTSMSALVLTNNQSTTVANVVVRILGS